MIGFSGFIASAPLLLEVLTHETGNGGRFGGRACLVLHFLDFARLEAHKDLAGLLGGGAMDDPLAGGVDAKESKALRDKRKKERQAKKKARKGRR